MLTAGRVLLARVAQRSLSGASCRRVQYDCFADRHIGPSDLEKRQMLDYLGFKDLDALTNTNVPEAIRLRRPLKLPKAIDESRMLKELTEMAEKNKLYRSYIGMGYSDCIVPSVIIRNMFQNATWLTSYTPYQAEISQGRLESLVNFQTMIADLTGLDVPNASLLDESTACAEAMQMAVRPSKIQLETLNTSEPNFDNTVAGVIVQYPNTEGSIIMLDDLIKKAHDNKSLVILACDLLSLALLRSPGDLGADVAVGSSQRFGIPLGFGGPHAAFMAVRKRDERNSLARAMPGRVIGVSKGMNNEVAYRLALQTREQHIRRDKATSNICTAQALLANMAAMYAIYHGPKRLTTIARNVHKTTAYIALQFRDTENKVQYLDFFDTLKIRPANLEEVKKRCEEKMINLRYYEDGCVGVALDETTLPDDVRDLFYIFGHPDKTPEEITSGILESTGPLIGNSVHSRTSDFLTHPVFNSFHSETQLMRYMKRLENRDVSLANSMIPLGSCTMKLNGSAELIPVTWPKFCSLHPFVPKEQAEGYNDLFRDLESWLCEITGYDKVSLQPNSGAAGEYAGMLAIRNYLHSIGEEQRDICLIPVSAHGTNPASAHMAGMKVVVVDSDRHGNINYRDLTAKVERYKDRLAAIMVTYPSTHGVFESTIVDVCKKIHENGGQVYLDGANLNAQVGLCRPGDYGSDVSHMNLHKTFAIPHGGGGPGVGPIGVKAHLAPFLPGHCIVPVNGRDKNAVSAAPYGSSSIMPITWAYIRMMGPDGLKEATQMAILNANYMARRLEGAYRIVYKDEQGLVAHEFLIDCKDFKKTAGVEVVDISKRLMDYGFHSPTMSFPVHDCLMIEPTESEDKGEMDRLVDSLLAIREEIALVEQGKLDRTCNPLKMAPHTQAVVTSSSWDRPYTREMAAFPKPWCAWKVWPTVGRIDDQYGDQHLVCSCPPLTSYN
ncbi:Glycine dehydrogenase [decarboxylating], mitochondrial [Toxocara canis]|uniref:Glycine cleavage system P protein n=1 Tax=Toxocara canis TaxID=6265 RepID=A0A0B2VPG6_TOXCA|nr:Glycine dehydrogenase [decarboxylating], mitochondrial [Toxocara canis]